MGSERHALSPCLLYRVHTEERFTAANGLPWVAAWEPPRGFGADVSTQILAAYGGDRPRNQGFPPPAGLLVIHSHTLDRTGRLPYGLAGKRVRREWNPALPQPADGEERIPRYLGCYRV